MTQHRSVEIARGWIGTPFHHHASAKGVGCDCLGLLRGVWIELQGVSAPVAPAYDFLWAQSCPRELLLTGLMRHLTPIHHEPVASGQILLFRWRSHWRASHIGIASSSTTMIHAYDGSGVCEVAIPRSWQKRIIAQFIFP